MNKELYKQYMDEAVSALASRLGRRLKGVEGTISCAESCTGGLLSSTLTDLSGASAWYRQSWITYTNEAKHRHLGVGVEMLAEHGAVSSDVAMAMAKGARERAGTTLAISITGIAGPKADETKKPIGIVYVGISTEEGERTKQARFGGSRQENKESFVAFALQFAIQQWDFMRDKDAKLEAEDVQKREATRVIEEEKRLKRLIAESKAKASAPWQEQVWDRPLKADRDIGGDVEWEK
jgi:nicotinamide-nucleotide amidase